MDLQIGKFFFGTACGLNRCWKYQNNRHQLQGDSFLKTKLNILSFVQALCLCNNDLYFCATVEGAN